MIATEISRRQTGPCTARKCRGQNGCRAELDVTVWLSPAVVMLERPFGYLVFMGALAEPRVHHHYPIWPARARQSKPVPKLTTKNWRWTGNPCRFRGR